MIIQVQNFKGKKMVIGQGSECFKEALTYQRIKKCRVSTFEVSSFDELLFHALQASFK